MGGDHHHRQPGVHFFNPAQHLHAVHAGHLEVQQQGVGPGAPNHFQGGLAVVGDLAQKPFSLHESGKH
jgi:hypothetical protein